MKILVRLPNWLGDLVMSAAFMEQLQHVYPESEISVIIKKGLEPLLLYFPQVKNQYVFSKEEFKGITGAFMFGRQIKAGDNYDLFFNLPDSFSSALMGYATGAKKRIGYKKELRSILLTNAYTKNKNQHRVEQYVDLLRLFTGQQFLQNKISFKPVSQRTGDIIININSEASSRRLPTEKAKSIIEDVRRNVSNNILLIGAPKEKEFVDEVFNSLADKSGIKNIAGTTTLLQLSEIFSVTPLILTTDSGPAHLANALGVKTIVLNGAGDERETAPFNPENRSIIRLGKLSCEPCVDNKCKRYGIPKCLTDLDKRLITNTVLQHLHNGI